MKFVNWYDEEFLLERLGKQLQSLVDAFSFREIKSNELLVRAIEVLEGTLKDAGIKISQ